MAIPACDCFAESEQSQYPSATTPKNAIHRRNRNPAAKKPSSGDIPPSSQWQTRQVGRRGRRGAAHGAAPRARCAQTPNHFRTALPRFVRCVHSGAAWPPYSISFSATSLGASMEAEENESAANTPSQASTLRSYA
eukprot:5775588-Prymnesium_polylepis.1